jgi:hypothetical protein
MLWLARYAEGDIGEHPTRTLSLRLPSSIHRHVKEITEREGVWINQSISAAVTEKVSALMTEDLLETSANKASKGSLKRILAKVPTRSPRQRR